MRKSVYLLLAALVAGGGVVSQAAARDRIVPDKGYPLIPLQVHRHEKELFGWQADFMLNVPNFDTDNRPYIRSRDASLDHTGFVSVLGDDAKWEERDFTEAVKAALPGFTKFVRGGGWIGERIEFDKDNHAYTIVQAAAGKATHNFLLYSADRCKTWKGYKLPGGTAVLEKSGTPRPLEQPPAIVVWKQRAPHPARFCSWNVVSLVVPHKTDQGLEIGSPVEVTQDCFGYCMHSGGASFVATHNGKTHIVWGEAAEEPTPLPGVPTYAATYDHAAGKLGEKVLMGYAPPVNDSEHVLKNGDSFSKALYSSSR